MISCLQQSRGALATFGTEMETASNSPKLLPTSALCCSFSKEKKVERFTVHLLRLDYFSSYPIRRISEIRALSCSMLMIRRPGDVSTPLMTPLRLWIMAHGNGCFSLSTMMSTISPSETLTASRQPPLAPALQVTTSIAMDLESTNSPRLLTARKLSSASWRSGRSEHSFV